MDFVNPALQLKMVLEDPHDLPESPRNEPLAEFEEWRSDGDFL